MESQQMMEVLLVMQEELRADREQRKADMEEILVQNGKKDDCEPSQDRRET
jgi:hypothetical protein